MTFAEAVGCSALRAGLVALLSVLLARSLQPVVRRSPWLALWPLLVPSLVLGFAYRNLSLALLHHPVWNELLYSGLLLVQGAPLAALVLYSLPVPPLSREARRLLDVIRREGSTRREGTSRQVFRLATPWRVWSAGAGPNMVTAGAIAFLIAFQEAEVASLMQAGGWPEWLFMQQSGGAFLPDAWPYVRWPALLAGFVLMMALICQFPRLRGPSVAARQMAADRAGSAIPRSVLGTWAVFSAGLAIVWPTVVIAPEAVRGFGVLLGQPRFLGEIGDALMIGGISGLAAIGLSGWLLILALRGLLGRILLIAACVPGLLGGLVWALMVKEGTDRWFSSLAETPVPLIVAMTLSLVPRGVLVLLLLQDYGDQAASHLARLLSRHRRSDVQQSSADLEWQINGQRWFWGTAFVCLQGYLELSITFLLRPPNISPAPVRLYNFLHYGRVPGLAAMLVLSLAAPLVVANAVLTLRRWVIWLRTPNVDRISPEVDR